MNSQDHRSVPSGSATGPGYHRLDKQNDGMHLDDDHLDQGMDTEKGYNKVVMQDDDDHLHHTQQQHEDGGETSSLVSEQELRGSSPQSGGLSGIFRESTTTPTSGLELPDGTVGSNVAKSPPPSSVTASSPMGSDGNFLSHRTRSSSWEDPDPSMLFQDEDDVDDVSVVRRYVRNRIPIVPAEFVHQPLPKRLWQSFVDLRTAARQRRAARLLNETVPPAWHCVLTWCCDATDRGIALVAICIILWLTMGWTGTINFSGYWTLGFILFTVRVSARTIYENVIVGGRVDIPRAGLRSSATITPNDHHHGVAMSTLSSIPPATIKTATSN